jgi:hypothetical protein
VASVQAEFDRWDLQSDGIGTITDSGRFVVSDGRSVVCDLPLAMLIDEVPLRHPAQRRPAGLDRALAADPLGMAPPWSRGETLLRLLASPNIGSRRPIFRRYDHQVGDDTVITPGGDAALLRVRGAAIAVCEAARNVVAVGAAPIALTNCLNFGNPEKPEVFWQLSEAIEGMREACLALGIPVVSGNVSLYNDTAGVSIAPTTVIGMVGHLEDLERRCAAGFAGDGDEVLLVASTSGWRTASTPARAPPWTSISRLASRRWCWRRSALGGSTPATTSPKVDWLSPSPRAASSAVEASTSPRPSSPWAHRSSRPACSSASRSLASWSAPPPLTSPPSAPPPQGTKSRFASWGSPEEAGWLWMASSASISRGWRRRMPERS